MATPKFINFSRFEGSLLDAVARIDSELCELWRCRLKEAVYLRKSSDPYAGGLELDGDFFECTTLADVESIASINRPFALVYGAVDPRSEFNLAFHDVTEDGYTITGGVESNMVYFRDDDEYSTSGQWFEGMLISLVTVLNAKVCAYGNTVTVKDKNMSLDDIKAAMRRVRYIDLSPDEVLERLRTGDLLELPYPVFHAISTDLIGKDEIDKLMKSRPCSPRVEYKQSPAHHIFTDLTQPK